MNDDHDRVFDDLKRGRFGKYLKVGGVWSMMDSSIDNWREDWEARLEDDFKKIGVDYKTQLKDIQSKAKKVIEGTIDLKTLENSIPKEIISMFFEGVLGDENSKVLSMAIREAVVYELSYELLLGIGGDQCTERLWDLFSLTKTHPGWRALEFLKRVSRCYIFGFDPECVIMCRSTLDSTFEAEVPNDDCISIKGLNRRHNRKGEPIYDLYDRIDVAKEKCVITKEIADMSHEIRSAGNKVVHNWPKVPKKFEDSFEIVKKTFKVIEELCNSK